MNQYEFLDDKTFAFLVKLRTYNAFWFMTLVRAAKASPKDAKECVETAARYLKEAKLDISGVNPFQIAKASRKGILEEGIFNCVIQLPAYANFLDKRIIELKNRYFE